MLHFGLLLLVLTDVFDMRYFGDTIVFPALCSFSDDNFKVSVSLFGDWHVLAVFPMIFDIFCHLL